MADSAQARKTLVAEAILEYLSNHPDAADSVDGIAKWWLAALGERSTIAATQGALDYLYALCLIDRQLLPDGRAFYRARRSPGGRS